MFVILDTNLFVKSWKFDSFEQRTFLDFVKRTGTCIFLPEIVWDELTAQYRSKLKAAAVTLKNHVDTLEGFFPKGSGLVLPHYDYEKEVDAYQRYLHSILEVNPLNPGLVIPYPRVPLQEIAQRGVNRIKPFNADGEEFRDAIVWYNVLETAEWIGEEQVVFVSNNVNEFADSAKEKLHPVLVKELQTLALDNVRYFPSLKKFIQEYHEPYQDISIDIEWVKDNLDYDKIIGLTLSAFKVDRNGIEKAIRTIDDYPFTTDEVIAQHGWCLIDKNYLFNINVYSFLDEGIKVEVVFYPEYETYGFGNHVQYITNFIIRVSVEYALVNNQLILDPAHVPRVSTETARVSTQPILLP